MPDSMPATERTAGEAREGGRCALVFTKPAQPGRVKTRLIGDLSAEQAASLHEAFLGDVVERMSRGSFSLRLAWALTPGEAVPDFRLKTGESVPGLRQEGRDLGERLFHGLQLAARDHAAVAALGSDHPALPAARVEEAFRRVEAGADVVLGPAEDGGYYLIAGRASTFPREIFEDVPWSTERVLEATLERCRKASLAVELLPEEADVDRPEDLRRLAESLAGPEEPWAPPSCPRTRALLKEWGRLPLEVTP